MRPFSLLFLVLAALASPARPIPGICLSSPEKCANVERPRDDARRPGSSGFDLWTSYDWDAPDVATLRLPILSPQRYEYVTDHYEDAPQFTRAVNRLRAQRAGMLNSLTEAVKKLERRAGSANTAEQQRSCLDHLTHRGANALGAVPTSRLSYDLVTPADLESAGANASCLGSPLPPMGLDGALMSAHARYLERVISLLALFDDALNAAASELSMARKKRAETIALKAAAAEETEGEAPQQPPEPAPQPRTTFPPPKEKRSYLRESQALLGQTARDADALSKDGLDRAVGDAGRAGRRHANLLAAAHPDAARIAAAADELADIERGLREVMGKGPSENAALRAGTRPPAPRGAPVIVPAAAAAAFADAARAVRSGDIPEAQSKATAAAAIMPSWPDPAWVRARAEHIGLADAARPTPQDAARASDSYTGFLILAGPDDPRRAEAERALDDLRALRAAISLPALPVTVRRKLDSPERAGLPLGRPYLYWDIGGGSFGGTVSELHALRVVYFPPALKSVGLGATAIARYRTPFEVLVSGVREKATVDALFPVEIRYSPLNIKVWRNTTLSPQLFASYAPAARFHTDTLDSSLHASNVREMGLRVPFGAFAGLRASWLSAKVSDAAANGLTPAYRGFNETRFSVGMDLFFGCMLAEPLKR